ncbi:amidinotransferase [Saccharopolyspora sp. HNM0983]|uniref:Amidinotransferase n=2 Tax=Saccharopolyspora montiporae TaxID=2781240 RepID=A0A929B9U9_9PSEU|nr:amidinotransferase [Saccharopolyspora sp. HNM0983]
MCPPRYFAVEYAINPWMDPGAPVDAELAMHQWSVLRATYERLGHRVRLVEPRPGLPDMVFVANAATAIDGRVLGARFRNAERAPEAEHFRDWLGANGHPGVRPPAAVNEAEGDLVWTGDVLLAGSGFRTDPRAHREAAAVLGVPVVSLELVDERYYHLDTALFVLTRGPRARIAYYPPAFSAAAQDLLGRMFPDAVAADAADAACLGLNAVSDGKHVVLPAEATGLAEALAGLGYEPIPVDVSELRKAGGGPKCCTLELHA